ncbi:alpha/beta fold hydrolase [Phycisphaera mikurensis]|nr:alpha/beta fold hydrolase [Phycisphaera mikurensis]MBB6441098.1 pimeloyl-ACP methyl ester carboxylesterase [Phycisphaera mikurensis]
MGLLVLLAASGLLIAFAGTWQLVRGTDRPGGRGVAWCIANDRPCDPEDLGLPADRWRDRVFRLSRGEQTRGYEIDGGDPDGPLVLVVHGHSAGRHHAMATLACAVPVASRVAAFDLPGHGSVQKLFSRQGLREPEDVAVVLGQLLAERPAGTPAPPVVLLGYSMGAQISLAAAAGPLRGQLAGVVLLAVYRYHGEPIRAFLREHGLPWWPFQPLGDLFTAVRTRGASRFDRVEAAADVDCPALLLSFRDDPLCPLASAEAIAAAIPHARLEVFDGVDHTDFHLREPQRYTSLVQDFLRSHRP